MKWHYLRALAVILAALLIPGRQAQAVLTFLTSCDINTPHDPSSDIHTGGILHTAMVPVGTIHHSASISGANTSQMFNVQWSMHVTLDGNIDNGSKDWSTVITGIITCDPFGNWSHQANATGQVNGSFISQSPGTHVCGAYCDFYDKNNSANHHTTNPPTRNQSVVDP